MAGSKGQISGSDKSAAVSRLVRVLGIRAKLLSTLAAANARPNHALPIEWRQRYEQARRGMANGEPVFRPSRQWAIISTLYRMMFRAWGFKDFKRTFGRFLAAYESDNPRYFTAMHHLYWGMLKPRDKWGLLDKLEEPALGDGDAVMHGGKRLSLEFLQSIDEFYRMQETLGFGQQDGVVFCEVGAGYGRLADVVLSAMPNARYVIFDLPESLTLSQYYLTARHPGRRAALYPESNDALSSVEKLKKFDLIFGVPDLMKSLPKGSVDVFINIYSFMEMSRDQIEAYFKLIDERDIGALYLKQHKHEVNLLDKSLNSKGAYPFRSGWKPLYEGTSALYEDVFESVHRLRA
jgi:putative sugar O-methyltransferase